VIALLEGTLTEELRHQAIVEAHTLVGSLGSFGFTEASRLSRELEHIFKAEESLSQAQAAAFLDWLWHCGKPWSNLRNFRDSSSSTLTLTPKAATSTVGC
jgi:chemotaxis protein histidine kinase CheA